MQHIYPNCIITCISAWAQESNSENQDRYSSMLQAPKKGNFSALLYSYFQVHIVTTKHSEEHLWVVNDFAVQHLTLLHLV